ncbi:MAG: hypothetical protein NDJ75_04825, partial [Thermoanaerobaculia bacterium]|nr:hypothetical protein [Thermoanaerobaculia bacterium]
LLRPRGIQLAAVAAGLALLTVVAPHRVAAFDAALLFVVIVFEVATVMASQIALGLGRTWVWSFRAAVANATLLLAVPALVGVAGPAGALQALAVASFAGLVFAGGAAIRLVWSAERGVPPPAGSGRYGLVTGLALLLSLLTYRGPVLAAGAFGASAVDVGFAGLAAAIAMAIMLAVHQVLTVSLPELVGQWDRDPSHAESRLRRLGWWAVSLLVLCALVGAAALDVGLAWVVGDRFAPAASTLVPILALLPLLPLPLLGWQGAALRLRPELALAVNATGAATFGVTAALLVPAWGAPGASSALLVAVVAASLLGAWKLPTAVPRALLSTATAGAAGVFALVSLLGRTR